MSRDYPKVMGIVFLLAFSTFSIVVVLDNVESEGLELSSEAQADIFEEYNRTELLENISDEDEVKSYKDVCELYNGNYSVNDTGAFCKLS